MTNPRALLDDYAKKVDIVQTEYGIFEPVEREEAAPQAFAALRAVLAMHRPATINAAATIPGDRCPFCDLGEPLRIMFSTSFVNGLPHGEHKTHEHADPNPDCAVCHLDTGEPEDWPCPTVQAITTALDTLA